MTKYRYGEMTWPEVKAAAARPCVAIVPIATLEDHGLHLPVDTDLLLCASVCDLAASRAADRVVLVPPIDHGYSPHHMDFPGALTIGGIRSSSTGSTSARASRITASTAF